MSDEKPSRPRPAAYAALYQLMVPIARRLGYALALHGTMARDLDVIAVPWQCEAVSDAVLVAALAEACGAVGHDASPTEKEHGRHAWKLWLGSGLYVDLSVMPRTYMVEHDAEALAGLKSRAVPEGKDEA